MPEPVVVSLSPQAAYDRKVALARKIVLRIAVVVVATLVTAVVFGAYNLITERPAKEMFFAPAE